LAATQFSPAVSAQIETLAKAICGEDLNPTRFAQAVAIAQEEIILRRVRAAQVAVFDRMRNGWLPSDQRPLTFPSHEEWARAWVGLYEDGKTRPLTRLLRRGARFVRKTSKEAVATAKKKRDHAKMQEPAAQPTSRDGTAQQMPQWPSELAARDEVEALLFALPELIKLDRYERRALSRHCRAVRRFTEETMRESAEATETRS
jgi:hypothetical protein